MFDTPQGRERIARLEARSEHHDERIDQVFDELRELNQKVGRLLEKQDRQLGFFSGIAFSFGLVGAVIGTFGTELFKRLAGN